MSGERQLNDCGCCEGVAATTPQTPYNRPGLDQLVYRVGTHGRFRQSMLAGLSAEARLRALTTREDDDLGIALIDAFAVMLDILSFYQERIANEGFLRTAVERRSLLELARLIGYELAPGVAAGTWLAFMLDDREGSPTQVTIPAGTRAQSIPGQDELPQAFETSADLLARPQWSALKPRLTHPQTFHSQTRVFLVAGVSTGLERGDQVLLVAPPGPDETSTLQQLVPLKVVAAETFTASDQRTQWTKLTLAVEPPPSGMTALYSPLMLSAATFSYEPQPFTGASVNAQLFGHSWSSGLLEAYTTVQGWPVTALGHYLTTNRTPVPSAAASDGLYALRTSASAFGHNAPRWSTLPAAWKTDPYDNDWDDTAGGTVPAVNEDAGGALHDGVTNVVYLDREYPDVVEGSFVVVSGGSATPQVFTVGAVASESRADFGLSAKSSRLELTEISDATPSDAGDLADISFRRAAIHTQSEALALIELPIEDDVAGDTVELEQVELLLTPGRTVIVRGERSDLPGVVDSEAAVIRDVQQVNGYTRLIFEAALEHAYVRTTTTLYANVVAATHGETRRQILGSGDASRAFQRFLLKQSPLTYVPGTAAGGADSTAEVRVGGVLWHEAPDFYRLGPRDRRYVLRRDDDGNTTVAFGDGRHGARLPTGRENVAVTYRVGIGTDGHVDADRITLLASPPLGVREVFNPAPASGAENPEVRDDARENAPTTVRTLERIVSLTDFEDYARTYAGIAMARADAVWDGTRRVIVVTVSGVDGTEVSDTLLGKLRDAMDGHRDPFQPLQLRRYQPRYFRIAAALRIDGDHVAADVLAAAEAALRGHFAFARRRFAEPVHPSEVIAVLHRVAGVLGVDLDALGRVPEETGAAAVARLDADPALLTHDAHGNAVLAGAQLLLLTPEPLTLEEMP